MAVKLRLKKTGRKNRPSYRIVATDAHAKRDGKELEVLGHYDPRAADKEKQVAVVIACLGKPAINACRCKRKTCQSRQFVVRKRAVDEKLQIVGTDTFTVCIKCSRPSPQSPNASQKHRHPAK